MRERHLSYIYPNDHRFSTDAGRSFTATCKTDASLGLKVKAINDLRRWSISVPSAANVDHALDTSGLKCLTKLRFGVVNSHQARNKIWVEVLREVFGNMVRDCSPRHANGGSNYYIFENFHANQISASKFRQLLPEHQKKI